MNLSDSFHNNGTKHKFKVLIGMDFGGKRAEPGEVRDDIPARSVKWLLKRKAIEPVKDKEPEA